LDIQTLPGSKHFHKTCIRAGLKRQPTMTTPHSPLKMLVAGVSAAVFAGIGAIAQTPTTDQLEKALIDARTEAEWPGLNAAEAAKNLETAETALSFVRDGISIADYKGSFHGIDGTLRTRAANNEDKAVLLAALLRAQGYETEIVSAPHASKFPAHTPKGLKRARPQLEKLKSLVAPVAGQLSPVTRDTIYADVKSKSVALNKEVATATALVTTELNRLQWKPVTTAASPAEAPKLIWVRARKGNAAWQNFDPYSDVAALPENPAVFQAPPAQVKLTVYSSDPLDNTVNLVQWEGLSQDIAGYDFRLGWLPGDEQVKALTDLTLPLKIKVKQWTPVLQMGAVKIKGIAFTPSTVTEHSSPKRPTIRVRISIKSNGELQVFDRVIHDLGSGFEQHGWIASHHIGYSVAGIPSGAIEARVLDELLDNIRLKQYAKGGAKPGELSNQRGFATRTAGIVNKMIRTAFEIDPTGQDLTWQGPALFIETVRLKKQGNEVLVYTLLDMVNHAFAPDSSAPLGEKIRWGLAVCAAEGQLLENNSVNHHLTSGDQPITKISKSNGDDIINHALADDAIVLARASSNKYAWVIKPDGTLLGVISERPLLQAKGGESPGNVVPAASGAFAALGVGALSAGGASPLGPLVGGIAGYLNELRKAYEGAAGKINRIADLIGGGGGAAPAGDDYDFRDLAENLVRGMGEGYAEEYVSSVFSASASRLVEAGPAGNVAIATGNSALTRAATMEPNDIRAVYASE
jgi:hypothetical protein